jgi:hypothetical protein
MTPAEVANLLRVPESALYTFRKNRRGQGPRAVLVAGQLRYGAEDVDAFVRNLPSSLDAAHRRSQVGRGAIETA